MKDALRFLVMLFIIGFTVFVAMCGPDHPDSVPMRLGDLYESDWEISENRSHPDQERLRSSRRYA
jgi:hypothetical protein